MTSKSAFDLSLMLLAVLMQDKHFLHACPLNCPIPSSYLSFTISLSTYQIPEGSSFKSTNRYHNSRHLCTSFHHLSYNSWIWFAQLLESLNTSLGHLLITTIFQLGRLGTPRSPSQEYGRKPRTCSQPQESRDRTGRSSISEAFNDCERSERSSFRDWLR